MSKKVIPSVQVFNISKGVVVARFYYSTCDGDFQIATELSSQFVRNVCDKYCIDIRNFVLVDSYHDKIWTL